MESIQIYINSKTSDQFIDQNIANAKYILPLISIPDGNHIYISVQKASIPYTFYNINSTNNNLIINYDDVVYNLYVEPGNYNINTFIKALKDLLPAFTITYNSLTNKLKFEYVLNFSFYASSNILGVLGFNESTLYTSFNNRLESIHCCNLASVKVINVVSNLTSYNINKAIPNNLSILCSIPVNSSPYSIIQYENSNNFRSNLYTNKFDTINIKLVDDLGNLIQLNGVHYSMTLQLDIIPFR